MSTHEIEGLLEDSVYLVAKSSFTASKKRDFLYNLYRFQNRFDTGYTHFRLMAILLELKFTYRIPLEKHPDYQKRIDYFQNLDVKKTNWLPSKVGKDSGSVYAREEKGAVFLYVDAGSEFWQRLCEAGALPASEAITPKKFEVGHLVLELLQEAKRQGNRSLLQDWYALLVNLLGYDLGGDEGFPRTFLKFMAQEEINSIRDIGKSSNVFSNLDEHNDWAKLATPKLKDIEAYGNNTERLFCIRWLLDFKSNKKELQEALAYREKIQYTHRFFLNEIEVYLVYGIHELEQMNIDRAKGLAKMAMEKAKEKRHPIKKAWIAAGQSFLDGQPVLNELLGFEQSYAQHSE